MRKILLPFVVALGVLLGAVPAQAGSLSWSDPAGDAITQAPMASEDSLDLLKTTLQSDAKSVKWTANLKKMVEGNPPQSFGYFFVFSFVYNDVTYDVRVKEDVSAKELTIRDTNNYPLPINQPCKDCKFTVDRKGSKVSVDLPIASLAEAIKAADPEAPPFAKGSSITVPLVESFRSMIGISLRADEAPAPEGTTYKV